MVSAAMKVGLAAVAVALLAGTANARSSWSVGINTGPYYGYHYDPYYYNYYYAPPPPPVRRVAPVSSYYYDPYYYGGYYGGYSTYAPGNFSFSYSKR